jgi:hypothetical protein
VQNQQSPNANRIKIHDLFAWIQHIDFLSFRKIAEAQVNAIDPAQWRGV